MRGLLIFYAGFSAAAFAAPPIFPPTFPQWKDPMWVLTGLLCLILLAAQTRWFSLSRPITIAIGWVLTCVAVIQAFVIGDILGMLAAMIAVAILALLTGQVKPPSRKALLVTHDAISGSWLGIGLVMLTLALIGANTNDAAVAMVVYDLLKLFDTTILPWASIGTIISGIGVSLTTKWALFQYHWVVTKLILALAVLFAAFSFIHNAVVSAAEAAGAVVKAGGGTVDVGAASGMMIGGFGFGVVCITIATVLSVYKPWGRNRWGEAARLRSPEDRQARRRTPVG
ncbi:hypothetical protein ACFWY5_51200 [Nonomuraea sp. NPDC059007]|uniref:hypothetical protein n=1 Tax=Nonomuraea sp. NPDC059007 TaxID=3346692 RepID=UPI003677B154